MAHPVQWYCRVALSDSIKVKKVAMMFHLELVDSLTCCLRFMVLRGLKNASFGLLMDLFAHGRRFTKMPGVAAVTSYTL